MQKHLFSKTYFLVSLIVIIIAVSCQHQRSFANKEELVSYLNKPSNGYSKEVLSNSVSVKLTYQPTSLMVQNELDEQVPTSTAVMDSLEKKYAGSYYFHLEFSKNGKEAIRQMGGFGDYSILLQTLAFQIGEYILLTTPQKDTIPLGDYYFDQTYGMASSNPGDVKFEFERAGLDSYAQLLSFNPTQKNEFICNLYPCV